jgi:hypothetical protein
MKEGTPLHTEPGLAATILPSRAERTVFVSAWIDDGRAD